MRKANLYAVMTAAAVSMAILSGCSGSQTAATTAAETTTVAEDGFFFAVFGRI